MKIFIDTAITEEIKEAADLGIISGVTTNPSLMAKSGRTLNDVITEILGLVEGPISAEVEEADWESMYKQAHEIVEMTHNNPNITIKLPMTPDGVRTCTMLSKEGIKTNVTLIFSVSQAILAMEAGATFISPFMGRVDDFLQSEIAPGARLIKDINRVKEQYGYSSQIIAASIRNKGHVEQAALAGADIATIPFKVIKQMYEHELTTRGLKIFADASKK
ncbi:MAG: transaldolase family protein [Bacillales bacterium]|nr:transaldolase family protein [Bacillales bacterium]